MERRKFLKVLGATGGGVAAFSCADQEEAARIASETPTYPDPGVSWGKAPCRYCGVGCGVEVGVKDGKAVAVRGDEQSPVNKGLLCVKGYHLPGMLYGRMVGASVAAGVVENVDTSKAEALPGVKAVWTAEAKKVRFAGQDVAAVAAVSPEVAADAARLVEVTYEEKPFAHELRAAMEERYGVR